MLYFEDLVPGQRRVAGSATITREEIIDFARRFDPQPFHLDEEAARRSHFGGIVASGWHTASLAMRLAVDGVISGVASMGSPGVDELRWLKPVRPGDTLRLEVEVIEARASKSKPDRGSVTMRFEMFNQQGELVMHMNSPGIIARRPSE